MKCNNINIQDINWTIRFTRKFRNHMLALDIVEYLINNDGEYVGSYYTFAEELRGDRKAASNVRQACVWLKQEGIAYAQSTKGNDVYSTVIVMDANWRENI